MQSGLDHEANAPAAYEFFTDNIAKAIRFVAHPSIAISGASPDGLVGMDSFLELRRPNTVTHIDTPSRRRNLREYESHMLWRWPERDENGAIWRHMIPRIPDGMSLYVQRLAPNDEKIATLESEVTAFIQELNELCSGLTDRFGLEAAA